MKFLLSLLSFSLFSLFASAATKNVLVTGYWPPTNEMLRELSPKEGANWKGKNWRGMGYDVYAYFPENTGQDGIGVGDFRVDFASVYNDFMKYTGELKPVAILSFGRGTGPWELERSFPAHFTEMFRSGKIPSLVGTQVLYPIPPSLGLAHDRWSSLPLEKMRVAVGSLGDRGLSPRIDYTGGAGDFLCGFLGYLETWYHDQHDDLADPAYNQAAGFIHVNGDLPKAKASMEASLEALLTSLAGNLARNSAAAAAK
ncbi:MAG TPA: hypothetical protein VIH99_07820 [Bdellovibrionota bacterium]|jgi:hypothetical protein